MSEIEEFIKKIEDAEIKPKDDWDVGFNIGLEWAVRILKKDKSGY